MLKASDLRDMSIEDLKITLEDLFKKLFNLKNELKRSKKLEKPHELHHLKKGIARLLTILHEKQTINSKN